VRVMQVSMCAFTILSVQFFVQAQKPRGSHPPEEKAFSAEIKMKHPVSLSDDVLQMLRSDKDVQRRCLGQFGPGRIQPAFFVASQIHLDGHKMPDLVVTSAEDNPCLGGANIDPFWVFYWTPGGYELGLKVDAHNLDVLKTKTRRYSDIRTIRVTGTELLIAIFKFHGSHYKVWRYWKEPIKM